MRVILAAALAASAVGTAIPATAQTAVEGRVDRLEREMRAVQRKVFPGGAGATVEPQITAPTSPVDLPGSPSSAPITDLTARVSALETSLRGMTGQVEQTGYRVRQLEDAFTAYKRATDARLKALEDRAAPAADPATTAATGDTAPTASPPRTVATTPKPVTPKPVTTRPTTTAAADPARATAVAAIERPDSGDAAEDGYTYGFRLWTAKLYPEAEAALKTVADKYPKHRRASFAQNLLGRAYLDEGKPSLASLAFYDSYKRFPDGERAPDSLFYLAQALVKLKKPAADVCKVYTELTDVYGSKISAGMKADVEKGRAAQKCK
ncbi:MAG: tetratricopeptide repeat protein [Pseudomonadota bacterium]